MRTAVNYLRKAAVLVTGTVVVLVGAALLVLPGPGWMVIFAGLGLLATEFPWAAALLLRAQSTARRWWARTRTAGRRARRPRRQVQAYGIDRAGHADPLPTSASLPDATAASGPPAARTTDSARREQP